MPEICLTEAYGLDSISGAFFYLEPTLSEHEMVRMQRAALHCYACAVMAMEKWSLTVFAAVFATLSYASKLEGALYHDVLCFLAFLLFLSCSLLHF